MRNLKETLIGSIYTVIYSHGKHPCNKKYVELQLFNRAP